MPNASPMSPAPIAVDATELWQAIEASIREACVLRAEGREAEAIVILQQRLPQLIAPWSRSSGLASEQCQQKLRDLIGRVQQQIATAAICKRLVLQSMEAAPARRGESSASIQVRRRIPLADIPGMLDALDEGERAAAFRRQSFSSESRGLLPTGSWA